MGRNRDWADDEAERLYQFVLDGRNDLWVIEEISQALRKAAGRSVEEALEHTVPVPLNEKEAALTRMLVDLRLNGYMLSDDRIAALCSTTPADVARVRAEVSLILGPKKGPQNKSTGP